MLQCHFDILAHGLWASARWMVTLRRMTRHGIWDAAWLCWPQLYSLPCLFLADDVDMVYTNERKYMGILPALNVLIRSCRGTVEWLSCWYELKHLCKGSNPGMMPRRQDCSFVAEACASPLDFTTPSRYRFSLVQRGFTGTIHIYIYIYEPRGHLQ